MNFGDVIKNEIVNKPPKDRHCKLAFLSGVIRGSGKLYENIDGQIGLEFKVFGEDTAMLMVNLLSTLFNYETNEISAVEDKLNKKDKFIINICGNKVEQILQDLGIIVLTPDGFDVAFSLFDKFKEKECCVKSFIRGLFISSGSCTVPTSSVNNKTGYHLEIVFNHNVPAYQVSEMLSRFGVITKIINRKETFVVYIKSIEEIKNFIAFLPAPVSLLNFMDMSISREISNQSNRQKNCDMGNVSRQIEASQKQLLAIEKIEKTIGLNELKPDLQQLALVRKEFPDENVMELAERLNQTKSCLNHRFRKIIEIAKEL